MPTGIMLEYKLSTCLAILGVDPLVTLTIFVIVLFLSPGLIRSGL